MISTGFMMFLGGILGAVVLLVVLIVLSFTFKKQRARLLKSINHERP